MGRYWKKHQRKDVESVLQEFDEAGWSIEDPPTYYRVMCPEACGLHMRWIHLTPSGANYARDVQKWLYRQPCYKRPPTKKKQQSKKNPGGES